MIELADVGLKYLPSGLDENTLEFDPRPVPGGVATQNVDMLPSDGFFQQVSFKGAFGPTDLWIQG
eukprot:scaffold53537_cov45-Prasinocladus_malaysianus.AAC.1